MNDDISTKSRKSVSNKKCVSIILNQIPADGKVRIWLRDKPISAWALGDEKADLVGVSLGTASRSDVLKFNYFIINKCELMFCSYAACAEIRIIIYIQCESDAIRGYVDLPIGASAVFQSEVDRTSLVGLSSFALNFSA
jgi:hypothetical protein